MMWLFIGGIVACVTGVLPLVSDKYRKRTGGPVPIMFMSNPHVRRGFNRAQRWFHLAVVFVGLTGVLSISRRFPWQALDALAAMGFASCAVVFILQVSFNWPKWWISPESRVDEGSVVFWLRTKTGRETKEPQPREVHRQGGQLAADALAPPIEGLQTGQGQVRGPRPDNRDVRFATHSDASIPELPTPQTSASPSSAQVTFSRPKERAGRFATYKIWVDQQLAGRLRSGESLTLSLPPGDHECRATVQWSGSPTMRLKVEPYQEIHVAVRHAALRGDETTIDQSLSRSGWLELTVEPSRN